MYLGGLWYLLTARPGTYPDNDPVRGLDVAILQDNLLAPILGIGDPRSDQRVDFVGGIRGLDELKRLVDGGRWAVSFALYPTSIVQLFAVADAAPEVRAVAHLVTRARGGQGVARELVELILRAQGIWESTVDAYVQEHGGRPLAWP